jgi:ABC-2 type transport system ATP-binding protein
MSVSVQALTKIYGTQRAVDNVTFEVKKGEIVGFLGPNGAGKSTTMKIATCYLPPSVGNVEICGFPVTTHPIEVRQKIGYLPEHNPLYLDMYVKEYLQFTGSIYGIKGKKLTERIAEMIELTGLQREQHKKIGMLSKGYRQRVGLANALIHDPEVLILDEPTTGLDPNQIIEIRNLIKKVGEQKTVIFSTHVLQEVQAICDRVIIINLGKIVADDSTQQLLAKANAQSTITVQLREAIAPAEWQQIDGVVQAKKIGENWYELSIAKEQDVRADIFSYATKKGWTLLELKQTENSLEKIFHSLTQK